jgi:hypothetical protein
MIGDLMQTDHFLVTIMFIIFCFLGLYTIEVYHQYEQLQVEFGIELTNVILSHNDVVNELNYNFTQ